MASEAVVKYLQDTNRPYSCADITVNLRGAFTKSAIQKALDALSESAKIKCKLYGKQKVYAAIQTESKEEDTDIEDYEGQIKTLTQTIEDKSTALKLAESNLKTLTSAPTTDYAISQIEEIRSRIEVFEAKLETLRTSTAVLSVDEKKAIMTEHEQFLREYRKRKRITSDMVEAMMEGYPKSKKTFMEELCIETDEMAEFKLMGT